ncbi:GH3 family [Dillenia turbinata]|uniref:GH3 family n=1 Tax=Dillenia turbinata TaxID=194707 RepID=A0AAN8UL37_9MAGN
MVAGANVEKLIEDFEAMTKDAGRVQIEFLKKLLEENGEVEYLQQLGLNGRTDPESYKSCVPLVTHEELQPYIQRIVDGDTSPILTKKPVTILSQTSGTSGGAAKYIPFNEELMDAFVQLLQTSFAYRNSKVSKSKGGLRLTNLQTNLFMNPKWSLTSMKGNSCSPEEIVNAHDYQQTLYCHLLCGLIQYEEVEFVMGAFAHTVIMAFQTLSQVWQELIRDIRRGQLSDRITVPSIREAMSKLLDKPDAEKADLIYKKCLNLSESNWIGAIPTLFPNAKYVHTITTGTMVAYVKKLGHYGGDLPLIGLDYGPSEGVIGVNVNPRLTAESTIFTVVPNLGYFEFIPLDEGNEGDEQPKTVGLTEVEVGKEYEIVLSYFTGMYRYKVGDVVKITGFYNSTPQFKFLCRRNALLSINVDKNTEQDVLVAVEAARKLLSDEKLELVDFTSHVDKVLEPGHYVIFWELSGEASEELLGKCCTIMDTSFADADVGYIISRRNKSVGPLELRIMKNGTFQKILENALRKGTHVSQFKTPRYVPPANKAVLEILEGNVVKKCFSTAY